MYIEKLEIKGFGKLEDTCLLLGKGINLIYGFNEAGKTTLQWFIRSMLFGLKGGRASRDGLPPPAKLFKPWNSEKFGGSMEYRLDNGMGYRIERNFANNNVDVYDEYFNNVSASFDYSREKGLLIAEKHLGTSEEYFEKTVFIKQLETRLDEADRQELLRKVINIYQTGAVDVSCVEAGNKLRAALKNCVGTDRTRTSPIDKINARLEVLEEQRRNAIAGKTALLETEAGLKATQAQKAELTRTLDYIKNIGMLIEMRKLLEKENEREASLQEIYELVLRAERAAADAKERYERLGKEAAYRNTDGAGRNYFDGVNKDNIGRARNNNLAGARSNQNFAAGARRGMFWIAGGAVAAVLGAVLRVFSGMDSGKVFDTAAAGMPEMPGTPGMLSVLHFILSAVLLFAGIYKLVKNKSAKRLDNYETKSEAPGSLEAAKELERLLNEIIELKDNLKAHCEKASAIAGKPAGTAAEVRELHAEAMAAADSTRLKLESGISTCCKNFDDVHCEVFDRRKLRSIIMDSSAKWLENSWQLEHDRLEGMLDEAALKLREYETILRKDNGDGEGLQAIDEEIAALEQEKSRLEEKGEALKLALSVLEEAADEIHRNYVPELNSHMGYLVNRITAGKYSELKVDDRLNLMAFSPQTAHVAPVQVLSRGTVDQMYLALRLAAAELAFGGETVPVILDEVFSQYDDTRTLETLKLLKEQYSDGQVLIFTSKSREVALAEQACGEELNIIRL